MSTAKLDSDSDSETPLRDGRMSLREQNTPDSLPLMTGHASETSGDWETEFENSPEELDEYSETYKRSGFSNLSKTELANILLLFSLYYSQGILVGLAGGTVPTILKPYLSYGKIGLFSVAFYPFSLKLLWSPLIDSVWLKSLGRRKTWIVPSLLLSGLAMLVLGWKTNELLGRIEESHGKDLTLYIGAWFFLILLSASQSCAADGWTVSLLPARSLHWASSAHNLGSVCGEFTSYALFFFLVSSTVDSSEALRQKDGKLVSLSAFMMVFGGLFFILGMYFAVFKQEISSATEDRRSIAETYNTVLTLLRNRAVQSVLIVHLVARIGFEVNDTATNLKLLDKGFGTENIAIVTTIDVPFDVICSFLAGALCIKFLPLQVWRWAFVVRLITALIAQGTIILYPQGSVPAWYYFIVIIEHILSTSTSTVMFVTFLAFHLRVSDPSVGGVYMTLLATAQNLGGTLPRIAVMKLIQVTTYSSCNPDPAHSSTKNPNRFPSSCAIPTDREYCQGNGGVCSTIIDGYDVTNLLCVVIGGLIFVLYIRPTVKRLQNLPRAEWLVKR